MSTASPVITPLPQSKIEPKEWNDSIEQTVKNIGETAKGYKIMHIEAARSSDRFHNILMYSGIIIGPLAGLISGVGAIRQPAGADITFEIITSIIAFISGIIVSIIKFGSFEISGTSHKTAAAKYTSLESNVRRQLSLFRQDRIASGPYIEWLSISYDEVFSGSPFISTKIYNKYVEYAKKHNLNIPGEYNMTIAISKRYEEEKTGELANQGRIEINHAPLSEENPSLSIVIDDQRRRETSLKSEKATDSKILKRGNSFTHYPDMNRFSDGKMRYEMKRMMGMR